MLLLTGEPHPTCVRVRYTVSTYIRETLHSRQVEELRSNQTSFLQQFRESNLVDFGLSTPVELLKMILFGF